MTGHNHERGRNSSAVTWKIFRAIRFFLRFEQVFNRVLHGLQGQGGAFGAHRELPHAAQRRQVAEVVGYLKQDSGFVFCAIHNLLAEIPAEKIVAIYRTAAKA